MQVSLIWHHSVPECRMLFFLRRLITAAFFCFLPALAVYFYDVAENAEKGLTNTHAQIGYIIADRLPQAIPHLTDPALTPLLTREAFATSLITGGILFGLCFLFILIRHIRSGPERLGRGSVFSRAFERKDKGIKYKRKNA